MAGANVRGWAFAGSLPLVLCGLALGNLLGVILTAIWGWQSIQYGEPGNVALSFVQGYIGPLIGLAASDRFLKSIVPADFWLKWLTRIFAVLLAGLIVFAAGIGHNDISFRWQTLSAITWLIGVELGRRIYDQV